jgi:hypothetical protein
MKRIEKWVWASAFFLLGLSSTIALQHERDGLSNKQRWDLEFSLCQQALAKNVPDKCKLYGKIQFVDHFPDVKVKIVDHFPDIKVKQVKNFADKPGLWKIVDNFPDYKVQIVDNFPDYKVKYVSHFPGCD